MVRDAFFVQIPRRWEIMVGVYGADAPCLLMVFSNPRTGAAEDLAQWYMEVHGPDALKNGSFYALHRYEALGTYHARFLALWEGEFESLEQAKAKIVPNAGGLRDRGRISSELEVVWSALIFLTASSPSPGDRQAATLTLVEGSEVDLFGRPTCRYGDVALYESTEASGDVIARWAGRGDEGIAPHGPYRNIFDRPDVWPPPSASGEGVWVSHWRPIASLRHQVPYPEER